MTDTGNLSLPPGAVIHGDVFTGGQHIYNYFVQGLDSLPTHQDVNARVRKFLEYYVGTPAAPAPFGGRAADLAALDEWLTDPAAPPYALLAAPAGRGKSGLLAHWVTRLRLRQAEGAPPRHIIFFPISLRFNTHAENVVFVGLAARLAHVYGETLGDAHDALQYRGLFSEYLRRRPPDGLPVLVVVDGLDEAAGWQSLNDVFPYSPPPHLRVLAAARLLAGDPEGAGWLTRLGWEAPGRARRLSLAALDRAGVADVLRSLGNPLQPLAANYDLITKLCELSAGDPLLVRLYVEALLPHQGQAAAFTPADLENLEPGLAAYFNRWFEEQRALTGADPRQDKRVRGLLNLCAMALGPLQRADLLELAPDLFDDSWTVDEAARAVNRFLVGDGDTTGYAFSHPRLDDYFAERLTAKERRAWLERFFAFGRRTLATLQTGELPPVEASPYLLQFYGAHLDPDPEAAPDPATLALLGEAWLRAHEAVTGSPAGFLADARRAWRRAEADGPAGLGAQVLAALCFASVTSLSASVPADLLVQGAATGLLSPALALVLARQKTDPFERATALARLAPLTSTLEREALLAEAVAAAGQIAEYKADQALLAIAPLAPSALVPALAALARDNVYVMRRAAILAALSARLPEAEAAPLRQQALAYARAESVENRVQHLLDVVPYLPPAARLDLAREALTAAGELDRDHDRALFLSEASEHLPEAERPAILGAAFEIASELDDDDERAELLLRLAGRLPAPEREQVLASLAEEFNRAAGQPMRRVRRTQRADEHAHQSDWAGLLERFAPFLPETDVQRALERARTIDSLTLRAQAIAALAPRLLPGQRRAVVAEVLAGALAEPDEYDRQRALEQVVDETPPELLPEAVAAVRALAARDQRALLLARLAARLPPAQARPVLAEALAAARALNDEGAQAGALAALAAELPLPQREAVLAQAWGIIQAIPHEGLRLGEARRLAAWPLPAALLDELVAAAQTARSDIDRCDLLAFIAPQLSPTHFQAAVTVARAVTDAAARCRALLGLAAASPAPEALALFTEAALAARETEYDRPEHLLRVASAMPPALRPAALAEAAAAIRAWPHAHHRAGWLGEASALAEGEERRQLAAGALAAVSEIRDSTVRGDALAALAPVLPPDFLHAAVQVAGALESAYDLAGVLEKLAPRLPDDPAAWAAALDLARRPAYPEPMALSLAALAAAPAAERAPLVDEALGHVQQLDLDQRARVLVKVAALLPAPDRLPGLRLAVQAAEDHQPWRLQAAHGALLRALPEGERLAYARDLLDRLPHLSESDTQSASAIQAQALRLVYDGLPDGLLAEALRLAWPLAGHGDAEAVIRLLGPRWAVMCAAGGLDPFTALTGSLRAYLRAPRRDVLLALTALAPAFTLAGGAAAVEAAAQAVLDAGRWWA